MTALSSSRSEPGGVLCRGGGGPEGSTLAVGDSGPAPSPLLPPPDVSTDPYLSAPPQPRH